MSSPTISVLIPLYNAEKFIAQAIESVLDQTFVDFELIIVDNCSTDKSFEIASEYTVDKRVKLFQNQENIGMVRNWNQCLLYATGEYLKFLFADDYFEKNALHEFLIPFQSDKSISLVIAPRKYLFDDSTSMNYPASLVGFKSGSEVLRESQSVNANLIGEPSFIMFRKKDLNIGLFNTDLYWTADIDYWFRICLTGNVFAISNYCVFFRRHETQATTAILKNKTFLEEERNYVYYSFFMHNSTKTNNYEGYYKSIWNKIHYNIYEMSYDAQKNYLKIWPLFKSLQIRIFIFIHYIYRIIRNRERKN